MDIELILVIGMFTVTIAALLAGYPVALTLGGVALAFGLAGVCLGIVPLPLLRNLPNRILGSMENQVLVAVPLFVLMGVILERSRVADDLLNTANRLLAGLRGGLGYAVIIVGALLAASTGIVGATVTTMTLIALPAMLHQQYNPRLATGVIAASGTLGQIIPPSIVLILLADAVSNASQAAAHTTADARTVSVGDLFAGALLPGLVLVCMYLSYLAATAIFRPGDCPNARPERRLETSSASQVDNVLFVLGAPLMLIIAVPGSILSGLASPGEASAVGAGGAFLLAGLRLASRNGKNGAGIWIKSALIALIALGGLSYGFDLRLEREVITPTDWFGIVLAVLACLVFAGGLMKSAHLLVQTGQFWPVLRTSTHITSMVFLILIGASLFALVFRAHGGDSYAERLLVAIPGGLWGALGATMLVMFILGFFLDFIEIVFVVVPIVTPPLIMLGADPVWLGILMALNLQTSFLTPPFGFALFYLRGAAPKTVKTADIWRGAIPFIALQIVIVAMVAAFPELATWLPKILAR